MRLKNHVSALRRRGDFTADASLIPSNEYLQTSCTSDYTKGMKGGGG